MIQKIFNPFITLPLWGHVVCAGLTLAGFGWVKQQLDASYAASNHPVDYATGQTAFDGEIIKGYYAHMTELGTLDIYWLTQVIDFGFICAMVCMGLFILTLVARLSRAESRARGLGLLAAGSIMVGAACDVIENGLSFIMLANPAGFANWLALPYSGFASLKFALITVGMGLICISLICTALGRLMGNPRLG